MGFSSALIGSAMAFDFRMFHEIAPTLKGSGHKQSYGNGTLRQNIYTEYLEEVVCYSKKEESANGYEAQRLGVAALPIQQCPVCYQALPPCHVARRVGLLQQTISMAVASPVFC